MSFPNLQYLPWCILAFVVLSLTYLYILLLPVDIRRRIVGFKLRLPPGPKGIPLFGNLFQFTSSRDGKQLVQYVCPPLGRTPWIDKAKLHDLNPCSWW